MSCIQFVKINCEKCQLIENQELLLNSQEDLGE